MHSIERNIEQWIHFICTNIEVSIQEVIKVILLWLVIVGVNIQEDDIVFRIVLCFDIKSNHYRVATYNCPMFRQSIWMRHIIPVENDVFHSKAGECRFTDILKCYTEMKCFSQLKRISRGEEDIWSNCTFR